MSINNLLLFCALSLSAIAGYYSIIGLAAIFAASFWPVVFMASILEISKLVVASWLYRNWATVAVGLRAYLTASVLILMTITSLGIFGFLSKAHVEQGVSTLQISSKLDQINTSITQHESTIKRYEAQLSQLDRTITQQLDANRTTQALNFRRQQETERAQIRTKLDAEQASLQSLFKERAELKAQTAVLDSKLGALKYVAELFLDPSEVDVERVVRYLIIGLVVVFDPLAVLMLIAANHTRPKTSTSIDSLAQPTKLAPPPRPAGAPDFKLKVNALPGEFSWHNRGGQLCIATNTGWKVYSATQPKVSSLAPTEKIVEKHKETQTIVQKQKIDYNELQKQMEIVLDKWLDKSAKVVQPPDISMIKEMVKEVINTPEAASPEPPKEDVLSTDSDERLRPLHPKKLARELRDRLKQGENKTI
jgi:hypothetical protein